MKKILTMILTLALVVCMIPTSALTVYANTPDYNLANATITSIASMTYDGTEQKPKVELKDANGNIVDPSQYECSYQNNKEAGTATVTVTGKGTNPAEGATATAYYGRKTENFTIASLDLSDSSVVSIQVNSIKKIADTYKVDDSVALEASGLIFYYKGSTNSTIFNDDNLTVTVTAKAQNGDTTLSVTGKKNLQGTKSGFVVQSATGLTDSATVSVANRPTYTGKAQEVKLQVSYNGEILVQGRDYEVTPKTVKNVSENTFNITGINKYAGTIRKEVNYIQSKSYIRDVKILLNPTQVKGSTPEVTVTDSSNPDRENGKLILNTDYKCYTNTLEVGSQKGSARIVFEGNYTGETTKYFDVVDANADLSKATVTFTATGTKIYSGSEQAPNNIQVTLSGKTLTKDKDYTIKYRYTENGQTKEETRPIDAKVYKVVAIGKGSYGGEATSAATFEISKYQMSRVTVSVSMANTTAVPTVTVKSSDGKITFVRDKDYSMSYSTNKNTGKVNVIITPLAYGNLTGIASNKDYPITANKTDISKYTVILRETTVTADGTAKTPVITKVAYGSSSLSLSDYTVSYQDSTGKTVTRLIEPGTYKVVVTGKNGYSGSCYATYTILGLTQSITGIKNYYKVYPTTQPFKLDPQAAEKTGFTFTSSDPTVASVDAYGYVTMHKPGRAKITITTKGTVKYNQATTSTEIRVYPNKVTMSRNPWTTGKKGQIKVRWNKRVGATRYEIRYSRQKSFKKGSYKTKKATAAVNSYSTQSTTVSKLRKGYTYYVKVRAVTQVYDDYGQKVNYYGNWSKAKTVKVK